MITHRAGAGEWPPNDPPERLPGGSQIGAPGIRTGEDLTRRQPRRTASRSPRTSKAPSKTRVVVVDAHDLIRAGIVSLVASDPDCEVVGEATDAAQALEIVRRQSPDVVLMDVQLPDLNGIEATRRLRASNVSSAVVLVSSDCDSETMLAALGAGVRGFVLKDVDRQELLNVIRRVMSGSHAIESTLATDLLRHMAEEQARHPAVRPEPLTPREVEVLRLIAVGGTNREIASRLIVAVGTVKAHVEHIMAKLGATDRTQAAVLAIEMGLIHPESPIERQAKLP